MLGSVAQRKGSADMKEVAVKEEVAITVFAVGPCSVFGGCAAEDRRRRRRRGP